MFAPPPSRSPRSSPNKYAITPRGNDPDKSAVGFAIHRPIRWRPIKRHHLRLPAGGVGRQRQRSGGFHQSSPALPTWPGCLQRDTTSPNIRNMILAQADGTGETIVATGQLFWDGWSPDSTHYAYGQDEPMNRQLGTRGAAASALGSGTQFRWVNGTTYVYLSGSTGAWTLMRGSIGGPAVSLASPAGEFVAYDLAPRFRSQRCEAQGAGRGRP
jgi:hypothetical protein